MTTPERVAIVMSRLPRLVDPRAPWMDALRTAIQRIKLAGDRLVVMPHTAGWQLVLRAARHSNVYVELLAEAMLPPEPVASRELASDPEQIPDRDRGLLQAATTILALHVRPHGNIHRGLREVLTQGRHVELVAGLSSASVSDDLLARGAQLWQQDLVTPASVELPAGCDVFEVVPFPSDHEWVSLTHTTRARPGPWPGQTDEDHLDDLLERRPDGDHSAVAVLERIVREQRLIASGAAIRAAHPVVCFTEVPLGQLPQLHRFRPHRTRWDFEPYGVCIDRDWLLAQGTQPVIYGDDDTWATLDAVDQYRFQRAFSQSLTTVYDWTCEREWRHAGDLDLSALPEQLGLVFVPDAASARRIAAVSRWPVTLWPARPD